MLSSGIMVRTPPRDAGEMELPQVNHSYEGLVSPRMAVTPFRQYRGLWSMQALIQCQHGSSRVLIGCNMKRVVSRTGKEPGVLYSSPRSPRERYRRSQKSALPFPESQSTSCFSRHSSALGRRRPRRTRLALVRTKRGQTMTREEAFARFTPDLYVEFYGGRWLID